VPDLAMLLAVQAGHDDRAPLSMEGDRLDFGGDLSAEMRGKRIGWLGDFGGFTPCEAGVLDVCRSALRTFEALGCTVEDARPDIALEPVWQAMLKLRAWQSGGGLLELYNDPAKRAQMKPEAIFEVESGLRLSAYDLRAASVTRSAWYNAVRRLFERYDYLVAPSAQIFPFPAELDWPHEIGGNRMQTYHEWQKGNFLITMTGCPALAVPAGFGARGLPIGIQIVAPINRERACLQLGHAYHQASNWTGTRLPRQLATAT
jgi:amidase